ncbi:MAG: hypothetical protein ACPLTQ_07775, partial [Anaerolineae bacterium]
QVEVPARDQMERVRVAPQGQRSLPFRHGPLPIPLRGVEGCSQRGYFPWVGPSRLRLLQRVQPLLGTVPVPIEAGQPQIGNRTLRTDVRRLPVGRLRRRPLLAPRVGIPQGQESREGVRGRGRTARGERRRRPAGRQERRRNERQDADDRR